MVALFSYGTLQQREVQLATFGCELVGTADVLRGYRLTQLAICDPKVAELSGKAVHTIAAVGEPGDQVPGLVFEVTRAELEAGDRYEVEAYARVEVTLESGRRAWAYVRSP
nr:gamma-glutamylcyclotransferase [Sphingomonas sp.]